MHLNLFIMACGHHKAAWRQPGSPVERLGDIRYYEELAQIAERGKLDAVFFADGQAAGNVGGGPQWFLEPLTALSAMARATERIGLISTVSSTFYTPFHAAHAGLAGSYLGRPHGLESGDLDVRHRGAQSRI